MKKTALIVRMLDQGSLCLTQLSIGKDYRSYVISCNL